jgi:hypothetical protein
MNIDVMQMVRQQLSDDSFITHLSQQIGNDDKAKTAAAANGVVTTLLGALAQNATTNPQSATALAGALDRDHDGSILNDVVGMLSGARQPQNQKMLNGAGILGHLLGNRQSGATNMISQFSGLNQGQISKMMVLLAPVVMGFLGKAKKQGGLDAGGLANLLGGLMNQQRGSGNPALDLIAGFLNQQSGGQQQTGNLAQIGAKLLGNLFKKR